MYRVEYVWDKVFLWFFFHRKCWGLYFLAIFQNNLARRKSTKIFWQQQEYIATCVFTLSKLPSTFYKNVRLWKVEWPCSIIFIFITISSFLTSPLLDTRNCCLLSSYVIHSFKTRYTLFLLCGQRCSFLCSSKTVFASSYLCVWHQVTFSSVVQKTLKTVFVWSTLFYIFSNMTQYYWK